MITLTIPSEKGDHMPSSSPIPDLPADVQAAFDTAVAARRRFHEATTSDEKRQAFKDVAAANEILNAHDPRLVGQSQHAAKDEAKARVRAKNDAVKAMPAAERIAHTLHATHTAAEAQALIDEVRAADLVTLPSLWECGYGPSEDEPYCQEDDDVHPGEECPSVRVHRDDNHRFAAMVQEIHDLKRAAAKEEREQITLIAERDHMHDVADKLAYAIAPVEVIGEHSSENNPWENALDHVTTRDALIAATARAAALDEAADAIFSAASNQVLDPEHARGQKYAAERLRSRAAAARAQTGGE